MVRAFAFAFATACFAAFTACSSAPPAGDVGGRVSPTDPTAPGKDGGDDPLDGSTPLPVDVGDGGDGGDGGTKDLRDFSDAVGSGTKPGLVTGRIYDDLAKNVDARMDDLKALGVRVIRIEIERTTPMTTYQTIMKAAIARGIEVLALVTQNSVDGSPNPMAGSRTDFDTGYVPKFIAAIDQTTSALPDLRYVEVWNEPDVYAFTPMYTYSAQAGCGVAEGAFRYALLAVRVFETMNERRIAGQKTPKLAAFSFSRQDDACLRKAVIDAQPINSHRAAYRPSRGLADGLPTDIVAIHGYGNGGKLPTDQGFTYSGGTFADGVNEFMAAAFADGRPMLGNLPVWYTEVGVCRGKYGVTAQQQAAAVGSVIRTLRNHPRITASFIYSYRDDEPGGDEQCGLRMNSAGGYAPNPSYAEYDKAAHGG